MGRASRTHRERRTGRTVRLRNELTGEMETFHDVKVSDKAIESWLKDRWLSVAAGYPNRPPDWDSPTTRAWTYRPGEHAPSRRVLIDDSSALVAFRQSKPVPVVVVGMNDRECQIQLLSAFVAPSDGRVPNVVLAVARGAVERVNDGYRARARLIIELFGVARFQEAMFPSEAAARVWLDDTLHSMAGPDAEIEDLQLDLTFSNAAA